MKYEIHFLGKTKDSFLHEGIVQYTKRLSHYTTIDIKIIKTRKIRGADDQVKEKEGDMLLKQIKPSTFLVALDAKGKQFSSEEFSTLITRWESGGQKQIVFVIGGPLGLSQKVLQRSDLQLSLSRMTFTHDMIRLFMLEQLYRAYTIKKGEKYHK